MISHILDDLTTVELKLTDEVNPNHPRGLHLNGAPSWWIRVLSDAYIHGNKWIKVFGLSGYPAIKMQDYISQFMTLDDIDQFIWAFTQMYPDKE